jgi:uncharacterized protein (TIGR02996 family)
MASYRLGGDVWKIVHRGTTLDITDAGATRVRRFVSDAAARAAHDGLVADRVAAGWQPFDEPPPLARAPRPSRKVPVVLDARHPELERAIVDDPDTRAHYAVYADWLQAQNDPRGDYIALAIAAEQTRSQHATETAAEHFKRHGAYLAGGQAAVRQSIWRWGFVRELRVGMDPAAVSAALGHPSCRFATGVTVAATAAHPARQVDAVLAALTVAAPPTLRGLDLAPRTLVASLHVAAPLLTRLRAVKLAGRYGVDAACCDGLIATSAPRLERLELRAASKPAVDAVGELIARGLPALTHLRVHVPEIAATVRALVASPLAPQLRVLELRGVATDADVDALIEHRDRFGRLVELWLELRTLTGASRQHAATLANHLVDIDRVAAPLRRSSARRYGSAHE